MMQQVKQAIVLAGGKGTRLAPLTEDTPKPLLPFLGKTVLETVFDRLNACGIRRARVTTMYLPWQVEALGAHFGELYVDYVREQSPLGTAGAVKNAYDGIDEHILVLSGDGVCDFDLNKAIAFHLEKEADVTVVTCKTEEPLEYGVVLYDEQGRIERFTEKPPWSQVVSGSVNTGIYILKKSVLDRIPDNTVYDFGKQLFPLLLASRCALYAYEAEGTWFDIGTLDAYYAALCACLDKKLCTLSPVGGLTYEQLAEKGVEFEEPVYVAQDAVLGQNVKLGPYTVIGKHAVISDGCDVSCSVLADGVSLGMGCGIYGTLIGRGARLGENCVTSEGCAIGGNAQIEDSVILPKYSLIHSGLHIAGSELLTKRTGRREGILFGENGIVCKGKPVTPEYLMRIGLCAGALTMKKAPNKAIRIGVLYEATPDARRVKEAILCGIEHTGAIAMDLGEGFEAMARFACLHLRINTVIFLENDPDGLCTAQLYDEKGLLFGAADEREFGNLFYSAGDYREPVRFYAREHVSSLWQMYQKELLQEVCSQWPDASLEGIALEWESASSGTAVYMLECVLADLGVKLLSPGEHTLFQEHIPKKEAPPHLHITFDAQEKLSITHEGMTMDEAHIDAFLLSELPLMGKKLYLSSESPHIYRSIAEKRGIEYTIYAQSCTEKSGITMQAAKEQSWLWDPIRKAVYALMVLLAHETAPTKSDVLPAFAVYTRTVEGGTNRAGIMQQLSKRASGENRLLEAVEGVCIGFSQGRVTVIPGKASGFRLMSEAANVEAARELCDLVEKYVK